MIPARPYFRKIIILTTGFIFLQLVKWYPDLVETAYAGSFYPFFAEKLRTFTGSLPISVGDLLYLWAMGWLLFKLFFVFSGKQSLVEFGSELFWKMGWIYLIFNLFWGLNYNRYSIERTMSLEGKDPGKKELESMVDLCIEKVNSYQAFAFKGNHLDSLKLISSKAYGNLTKNNTSFDVKSHSLKASLFGKLGNYLGYSGYYNPFSAEGHVNMYVPAFMLPYVSCHEIAHQLGYAKEDEANFIGYLAAKNGDSSSRYSVYFSSFLYLNRALYNLDSNLAKMKIKKLSPGVQDHLQQYRNYINQYHTPIETIVDYLYDHYLKLNEQPMGTVTYSKVVNWLVAYYRKNGEF